MGTNHIQCTALVSTSKVFWNVIHCWERKSELTCYFLSCLLMHWLGKKLISLQSHPPIKVSVLSPALSASWEKGKTKILKKLLKTVKKRRNLIFTPSLHVYNKAYAFNGSIWSGISINLGPKKKMPSVQLPINQPKWRRQLTFFTKLNLSASGLISELKKLIRHIVTAELQNVIYIDGF